LLVPFGVVFIGPWVSSCVEGLAVEDVVRTKSECVHLAGLVELSVTRISVSPPPSSNSSLLASLVDTLLILGATKVTKENIEMGI